ncbi:transcriptional antiterminator NusG [Caldanaerobius fijiensis DSM 17918]|uniref:Transcription termination/antitermination protein NusG n=1 Tax=Caldanaerobius fijiensis DSM 17918 TaxID=1121256 RepID=A0A1M4Z5J4_9THEO|nr:antiterminator LoaP [Caldanaerobius fijiensis]SHF12866.1 transcriptional antiterminator NusG [Caldanaerobius fijiensis DSM 17918]
MEDWYVIYTKSGNELNVKYLLDTQLADENVRVLVPRRKLVERRKGQKVVTLKTVFPGYVFIYIDMNDVNYYRIVEIPGVIGVLKNDYYPVPVPADEMKVVLSLTEKSEVIDYSTVVYIGGFVKVIDGPLKGLEGHIIDIDKRKHRARVRISIMGEPRVVQLGVQQLEGAMDDTDKGVESL